jgi:charged multivesicular body protein 1
MQAIQQNHPDIARVYAQNAIRKQNERLNLLRLSSRIDAVASRVQTAVTMRQVTGSMAGVVRGMEGAMKAMDLEKVSFEPAIERERLDFLSRFSLPA